MGNGSQQTPVLDVVRILMEIGESDLSIQDDIGDDCLQHSRTIPAVDSYLREQGKLPPSLGHEKFTRQVALNWAIHSCSASVEIKKLIELGADPRGLTSGFRNETGNALHTAAVTLNHLQGLSIIPDRVQLEAIKKENIALLIQSGAFIHVQDDQDCTPFDYVLELVRKFRYRRALHLWRGALEMCGIDWHEFLDREKEIHASRRREDYPAASDYYFSLQQQRDFWLSDQWEEEAEERFFWDPRIMDYLPPGSVPGQDLDLSRSRSPSQPNPLGNSETNSLTPRPETPYCVIEYIMSRLLLFLTYIL